MVTEGERLEAAGAAPARKGALRRALDSDLFYSFRRSPVTVIAAIVTVVLIASALACDWIAPHNPFDLASLNILDSQDPPAWVAGGSWDYPLGTDDQGRDVLSAVLYGMRDSIMVALAAV